MRTFFACTLPVVLSCALLGACGEESAPGNQGFFALTPGGLGLMGLGDPNGLGDKGGMPHGLGKGPGMPGPKLGEDGQPIAGAAGGQGGTGLGTGFADVAGGLGDRAGSGGGIQAGSYEAVAWAVCNKVMQMDCDDMDAGDLEECVEFMVKLLTEIHASQDCLDCFTAEVMSLDSCYEEVTPGACIWACKPKGGEASSGGGSGTAVMSVEE